MADKLLKAVFLIVATILFGCGTADSTKVDRNSTVGVVKLLGERRYEESYAVSSRLLKQNEHADATLLQLHGEVCRKLGLREEATQTYQQLLKINPSNSDAVAFFRHQKMQQTRPQPKFTIERIALALPLEPDPAYEKKSQPPPVKPKKQFGPADLVDRRFFEGATEARRQQMEADVRTLFEADYDQRAGWEERPMDQIPKRIVRADLGLGVAVADVLIPRTPSTGRYSPREMLEEPRAIRNRMLSGSAIAAPFSFSTTPSSPMCKSGPIIVGAARSGGN